jgi:hypothetical protein
MSKQAAGLVVRILRGANPGDIPVEQPARYEQPLLARADQIIE